MHFICFRFLHFISEIQKNTFSCHVPHSADIFVHVQYLHVATTLRAVEVYVYIDDLVFRYRARTRYRYEHVHVSWIFVYIN